MFRAGLPFLLSVLLGATATAQINASWHLSVDSLRTTAWPSLTKIPWRYQPGDNAAWAQPALNDQHWPLANTEFAENTPPPNWRGIGWFRLHVTVDLSLVGKHLVLLTPHAGASELYVDGQRVNRFGIVGRSVADEQPYLPCYQPVLLHFDKAGPHMLAMRYSNVHQYWPPGAGFRVFVFETQRGLSVGNEHSRANGLVLIPLAAMGLLAILYLVLFSVDRRRRVYLHYSLFLASFAVASMAQYISEATHNPLLYYLVMQLFFITNTLWAVTAAIFVHSVCQRSLPIWLRWIIGTFGVFLVGGQLLSNFSIHRFLTITFIVFLALINVVVVRLIGQAIRRRQPGIWLIGLGFVLVMLTYFGVAADPFALWSDHWFGQTLAISLGFLSLPLCFSIYLARQYGQTNRSLETQLEQVQTLSHRTIVQEQEKAQLLAEQNQQLEQQVQVRTQEIQAKNHQLTEQKTAIEQQAQALSELDELKTRFFTNITHEFRTPLTLMLGPAEQIMAQSREEPSRQNARLVQRNARRLLDLINQLLDLGKLEARKLVLQPKPGNLMAFVKGVTYGFESFAAGQQLSLHFEANCPALLTHFDPDKWEKILTNLLSNALKFTPTGGTIAVRFHYDATASILALEVADSGQGIPAHQVAHVFDRFYQGDSSDTRSGEGTGIGLALTKELVELHGGHISLTSSAEVGTTVRLRVPFQSIAAVTDSEQEASQPLVPSPAAVLGDTQPDAIPVAPERPTWPQADAPVVLVVEDNADVRAFIRSALAAHYTILEATNGEEGLNDARQQVPDLVITDLMMPKLDGHAFCRALKADERTSHIPLIMLTAKASVDNRIVGLETGADSYVVKPFHTGELVAQVDNLIRGRQQLRDYYRRLSLFGLDKQALPSMEQVFLERVRQVIDEHLTNEQFGVDVLCAEVGMSRMQLHRKLKTLLDLAPGDLIRHVRLERAHALLLDNVGTVAEVAYAVGFGNPANFSTSFSRHFGYAPSEVRRQAPLPVRE